MATASVIDQMVQSLAFEVEAVPQEQDDTKELASASHSMPLNVKIRVKKKNEYGMQQGILSVPKFGQPDRPPERIRLISSDQTIMSFDMAMEADFAKKPKRKSRRYFFSGCLGTQYDEDEFTYLPSTIYNTKAADGNVFSKSDGILKQPLALSKTDNNAPLQTTRKHDILGKCKPGGCLDPPFGEEKYAYEPKRKSKRKNTSLDEEATEIAKIKLSKHSEVPNKGILSKKDKEKNKIAVQKTIPKLEDDSILSLYEAKSRGSADSKYSDSVITYPPEVSSSKTSIEKTLRSKAISEEKQRKSFNESIEAFFSSRKSSRLSEKSENFKEFSKNGVVKRKEASFEATKVIHLGNDDVLKNIKISTTKIPHLDLARDDTKNNSIKYDIKGETYPLISHSRNLINEDIKPVSSTLAETTIDPNANELLDYQRNASPTEIASKTSSLQAKPALRTQLSSVTQIKSTQSINVNKTFDQGLPVNSVISPQNKYENFQDNIPRKVEQNIARIPINSEQILNENGNSNLKQISNINLYVSDAIQKVTIERTSPQSPLPSKQLKYISQLPISQSSDISGSIIEYNKTENDVMQYSEPRTNRDSYHKLSKTSLDGDVTSKRFESKTTFNQPNLLPQSYKYDERPNTLEGQEHTNAYAVVNSDDNTEQQHTNNFQYTSTSLKEQTSKSSDFGNKTASNESHLLAKQPKNNDQSKENSSTTLDSKTKGQYHSNALEENKITSQDSTEKDKETTALTQNQLNVLTSTNIKQADINQSTDETFTTSDSDVDLQKDRSFNKPGKITVISKEGIFENASISSSPKLISNQSTKRSSLISESDSVRKPISKSSSKISENKIITDNPVEKENIPTISPDSKNREHSRKSSESQNLLAKNESIFMDDSKINEALGLKTKNSDSGYDKQNLPSNSVKKTEENFDDSATHHNLYNNYFKSDDTIEDHFHITDGSPSDGLEPIVEEDVRKISQDYVTVGPKKNWQTENASISSGNTSIDEPTDTGKPQTLESSETKNKLLAEALTNKYESQSKLDTEDNVVRASVTLLSSVNQFTETSSEKNIPKTLLLSKESVQSDVFPIIPSKFSLHKKNTESEDKFKTPYEAKSSLKSSTVSLDFAFQSYVNDKNQRTLKTVDASKELNRQPDDAITIIQSRLRPHANEIRIPVDSENDMSIQIKKTKSPTQRVHLADKEDNIIDNKGVNSTLQRNIDFLKSPETGCNNNNTTEKVDKIASKEMQKLLSNVYEQELLPLQNTIQNLKQEIDLIYGQQSLLVEKLCKAIKAKPTRLVRVNPRCGCYRK